MSQENVGVVRRGYEHFRATGDFLDEIYAPDFVWDISTFRGWPEQQIYLGLDGHVASSNADPAEALKAAGLEE